MYATCAAALFGRLHTSIKLLTDLASHSVRTQFAEAERRRDFSQQRDDVEMLDSPLGVGVVFAPQANKLVQVVRTQDRPISGQVVKVVHDDGHEEVDDLCMGC